MDNPSRMRAVRLQIDTDGKASEIVDIVRVFRADVQYMLEQRSVEWIGRVVNLFLVMEAGNKATYMSG